MAWQRWTVAFSIGVLLAGSACSDGTQRRIGDACEEDSQCETGLCGGNVCLDPVGDDDGDGLTNFREVALGTNPRARDTDNDGVDDGPEVGETAAPTDSDEDGAIDAIESRLLDCDEDDFVDQEDPEDGTDGAGNCLSRCAVRDAARVLLENTTADGELTAGDFVVYAVAVERGATYTLRLYPTEMEANPDLRVFGDPAVLCAHATAAAEVGLAAADKAAPPLVVRTPPASEGATIDVIATSRTLFLRVGGTGGYSISAQLTAPPTSP